MLFSTFVLPLLPAVVSAARVVALGSSYSYGAGLTNPNDPINGTYGAQFAHYIQANFTNHAVSGSQLINIYNGTSNQLSNLPNDTTHVVISAGGNDLGWIGCVMTTGSFISGTNYTKGVDSCSMPANRSETTARYVKAVQAVYSKLASVGVPNPNSTLVYMVTYVHLFGSGYTLNGTSEVPQNSSVVQQLHNTFYEPLRAASVDAFNTVKAQNYTNVRLITMVANSVNNAIDAGPANGGAWTNGANNITKSGAAWHPNIAGHHKIAGYLYKDLTGNFPTS